MRGGAAALVALLILLGGCTVGPAAVDPSGAPVPASTVAGPRLAPPVPAPRDARGIGPCELLTPSQLVMLDFDPATRRTVKHGVVSRCSWRTEDGLGVLTLTAVTEVVPGLGTLYQARGGYDVFEPGEIDGFPVVHADLTIVDDECTIYAGVADDQVIWAAVGLPFGHRPACDVARQTVSAMLSNLPPLR
jgi:hypothetical protein